MTPPPALVLVYDGDCPFCEAASRWLVARGLLGPGETRPFQAFEGTEADRLVASGIGNELLLLEPATGRVRGGVTALAHLLRRGGHARSASLLAAPFVRPSADRLYRLVARNRRWLAPPPRRRRPCACDPEPSLAWRLALLPVWPAAAALVTAFRIQDRVRGSRRASACGADDPRSARRRHGNSRSIHELRPARPAGRARSGAKPPNCV